MPEQLSKEQLAGILSALDEVCQQAQDLSEQIRSQMAQRWRDNQPSADVDLPPRRRRKAEKKR